MTNENHITILDLINREIYSTLIRLKHEQYAPSPDVDAMDDTIAGCTKRILALRDIRQQLEEVLTGAQP